MATNWFADIWNSNPGMRRVAGDALSDLGYGLSVAPTFGDAFGAATQFGAKMAPYRDHRADQATERQRQSELATKYADIFRGWGPEYEDFAVGVETGAFSPADAFGSALEYRQGLEKTAQEQAQLAGNAQLLPEGPWRDAYTGGALNFNQAYQWSQGGGEPDPTDTMRNLDYRAQQAGLEPGTPEYQAFMVSGGTGGGLSITADGQGGFSITQGGPGGKFNQTIDAGLGAEYTAMQQDALSAMRGMASLDAMEQAMADPSFYSGVGSDQVMGLKRAAAAIGIDPAGVSSMETFGALSKQAALDAMGGSLGTGFSNADRDFVEEQVPTLSNTPEGNRVLNVTEI